MAIVITPAPLTATDEESGWSMAGGRRFGDGASTKEMVHDNGAKCTVNFVDEQDSNGAPVMRVTGLLYLNPGEAVGEYLLKPPGPEDFVTTRELYEIAAKLTRAWYQAAFSNSPPVEITFPKV